jgi:hypothetical protein
MEPQLDNAQVLTSGTDSAENFNLASEIFPQIIFNIFNTSTARLPSDLMLWIGK